MIILIAKLLSAVSLYFQVHFEELFWAFNHRHDSPKFSNMVWISETHRFNCRMRVCWKSSVTTNKQLLPFSHCSQGSFCVLLYLHSQIVLKYLSHWYMFTHSLWNDSMRIMTIAVVCWVKDLLSKDYCMQSHQKVLTILRTTACRQRFSHKLTHLLILTLFEGCLVCQRKD